MHRSPTSKTKIELLEGLGADPPVHRRGHVADPEVLDRDVVLGRATLGVPAAQDDLDARVGMATEVGVVGVVHRGDAGRHRRTDIVVVVGYRRHPGRGLDEEARMAEERHLNGGPLRQVGPLEGSGPDTSRTRGDRKAAGRQGGSGEQGGEDEGEKARPRHDLPLRARAAADSSIRP